MKKFIQIAAFVFFAAPALAQDFNTNISTAKAAYQAGRLEESHFALQKAMQELDLIIGREVMKLLPLKMDTMAVNSAEDNVGANVGFVGATVHRSYGKYGRKADLDIISNSPMVAMINSMFNSPLLANMGDANNKTVKVQGYKARLEKKEGSSEGKTSYELQVPLGSALITFRIDDATESEALAMANTLPLQQIAKLIQ